MSNLVGCFKAGRSAGGGNCASEQLRRLRNGTANTDKRRRRDAETVKLRATSAQLLDGVKTDGKSFRSQGCSSGQACTTCGADPLSDRPVHFGGGIRPYLAVDEGPWPRRCGILQPASGSDLNLASS